MKELLQPLPSADHLLGIIGSWPHLDRNHRRRLEDIIELLEDSTTHPPDWIGLALELTIILEQATAGNRPVIFQLPQGSEFSIDQLTPIQQQRIAAEVRKKSSFFSMPLVEHNLSLAREVLEEIAEQKLTPETDYATVVADKLSVICGLIEEVLVDMDHYDNQVRNMSAQEIVKRALTD